MKAQIFGSKKALQALAHSSAIHAIQTQQPPAFSEFLSAVYSTIQGVHIASPCLSMKNPFTIEELRDGFYKVEGESWSFHVTMYKDLWYVTE